MRAAATDPAPNCTVGEGDRLVGNFARDRRQIAHNLGNCEGLAFREQFTRLIQELIEHLLPPLPDRSPTGISPAPAGSPGYAPEQRHPRKAARQPYPV